MKIQDALDLHLKEEASRIIGEEHLLRIVHRHAVGTIGGGIQHQHVVMAQAFHCDHGRSSNVISKLYHQRRWRLEKTPNVMGFPDPRSVEFP